MNIFACWSLHEVALQSFRPHLRLVGLLEGRGKRSDAFDGLGLLGTMP